MEHNCGTVRNRAGIEVLPECQAQDKNQLVEYDFDASEKLHVPGDWNYAARNAAFL